MVADFAASLSDGDLDLIIVDQERTGFAVTYQKADSLFIENIALLKRYQGKGIARQFFSHLQQRAAEEGLSALELYTNEKMTENLKLYARLGFQEIERREEDGFKRVYFRKDLENPI